jgi:hypothetical protein
MSGPKADKGLDFASLLTQAMTLPEPPGGGREFPDGFPLPASNQGHRVIESSDADGIPGLVDYQYVIQRRVFLIFRPWERCQRCADDIASSAVTLPSDSDYECPHTNLKEYKTICDAILAGTLLYGSEQESFQKDGTVLISLRWYEKRPKPKKKQAASTGQKEEPAI